MEKTVWKGTVLTSPVPPVMVNFWLSGRETSTVPVPVLDTVTV